MTVTAVSRTIQFVLAPVVMITSCGIIIGGILTRIGSLSDRMRAMAHERLQLICGLQGQAADAATGPSFYATERLREIDHQMPLLLTRHKLLSRSLQALYLAMLVFVVSMFAIGIAAWVDTGPTAFGALLVFLCGQLVLLGGLYWSGKEVRTSSQAVEYEFQRVEDLPLKMREKAVAGGQDRQSTG
jgi:hypothetical protein